MNKYDVGSIVFVEGIKYKITVVDWCDLCNEPEYLCESLSPEFIDEYMLESDITLGTTLA
jgi:hypothetical protein